MNRNSTKGGRRRDLRAQLLTEGPDTWHASGRVSALLTFSVTPNWALFLNASHRQSASVFSTVFSPEQHAFAGFFAVPPTVTYDKQSAMFRTRLEQSTAGAGAAAVIAAAERARIMQKSGSLSPTAIFEPVCEWKAANVESEKWVALFRRKLGDY